jgi:iron complex outermembrane receptor protein
MASNEFTLTAGADPVELAGSFGFPKNRVNMNFFWSLSDWDAGLYGRWTDGFDDPHRDGNVPSHIEWDTQVSYSGFSHFKLTLGVENVFDEDPPFALGEFSPQGFPAQYYDMRGRFYYVQAKLSLDNGIFSR